MTDFSPAVIDAAAEAMFDCYRGYNAETQALMREQSRHSRERDARTALAAALGVMASCPNCGGSGHAIMLDDSRVRAGVGPIRPTNVTCPDHREPVPQLLLDLPADWLWAALQAMGAVEQAGIRFEEPSMSGPRYRFTAHVRAPQNDHEIPVFRFVGSQAQER